MLNIRDIEKRLRENPEPAEVAEMRECIRSSFNQLEFVEDGHKYYLNRTNGEREELSSVSAFIHQFEREKDWETITKTYAEKHGKTYEEVKAAWHENNVRATTHGTVVHGFAEAYFYFITGQVDKIPEPYKQQYCDGFLIPYGPKQVAAMKFWEDVIQVKGMWPLLAETKVYTGMNDKFTFHTNYAGTFDLSFALNYKGKWGVLVYDYKTNVELSSSYNRSFNVTLKEPFDDLVEEAQSLYTLQLSAYSLAIKQLDFPVYDRKLIWLKDTETYEKISLPDVSDRLMAFLETPKTQHDKSKDIQVGA